MSAKEADDRVCAPCPLKERKSVVPLMQRGRVNVKRQVGTGRPPQYPEGSPLGDKCRYILITECRPMWEVPSKSEMSVITFMVVLHSLGCSHFFLDI